MTTYPPPSLLLASDLDGTLIRPTPGPDPDVAAFAGAFSGRDDLVLAYATGRHLVHAVEGIRGARLPRPHWLACDVGTSVYRLEDGEFRPDPEYRELMEEAFSGLTADEVRIGVSGTHGLQLQAEDLQTEFKISFYAPAEPGLPPLDALGEHILERIGGPEAPVTLVMSREVGTGNLLLDVLPSGVAKDRAVAHIREREGLAHEGVIYAGDSGNDRAAILAGYRSILVGNAPADLREELERALERRGMRDRLYLSEAHFTAGVLEGLHYFGVT